MVKYEHISLEKKMKDGNKSFSVFVDNGVNLMEIIVRFESVRKKMYRPKLRYITQSNALLIIKY